MNRKLLTDTELRARWHVTHAKTISVPPDAMLTPAARDFIHENGIELKVEGPSMTRVPVPFRDGKPQFVDASTGRTMDEKPEDMTHLNGNVLVSKLHPRIEFRGRLDSLTARILLVQCEARSAGREALAAALDEVLLRTRGILAAEVRETPLETAELLGMSDAELRRASHDVRGSCGIDHPIPSAGMGALALQVNLLRTQVREAELSAMRAFTDESGRCTRSDLVQALNRLSSGVYLIFCRMLAGRM